ncbi:MAG: ATP-dependent zinc metalloprotease FtsH [Myxococcota bacterium]
MRNRSMWMMVFFVILVFAVVAVGAQRNIVEERAIPFSELVTLIDRGDIQKLEVKGTTVTGVGVDGTKVRTTGPIDSDYYLEKLAEKKVVTEFAENRDSTAVTMLINVVPLVLLFALFVIFMRQLQVGSGKAMSFGKSRAKLLSESGKRITFADVAGADEAKEELEEIIQFLKDPRKFTRLGGRIPKGVLLMGSPGTGKTLLARAVAGEAGVPFFSISGSEFVEMFVGVGASRVRDLFEQAKKQAPCIIFIDEIDAVGRHRGAGLGGGHDEREQTLNQLLVEMDGFDSAEGVILVAATNRPDVLDPALLRPGRFDRRVVVPAPDVRGRLGILQVHARRTPLDEDVNLEQIAKGTPGFSGADLENVINEAALLAARANKKKIDQHDLETAKDKVAMGTERRSLVLSDAQKRRTAYHEAGHAIVARMSPEADPVNKITIIPRGMALGLTQYLPQEDRLCMSRTQLTTMLAYAMGGRAAEEILFSDYSTGAAGDIKQATRIAKALICEYGMSDALGPVAWGNRSDEVFLGKDFGRTSVDYSEDTAQKIDGEVTRLVQQGYDRARNILVQNLHILHKIAQVLLEKETIDGTEFERIVSGLNPVFPEPDASVA